ncbi:exodeoxyribonuclease VIII [Salmonella enterica]|nr:exodeoxyribonuclease VIII [Salmonella enterica]
MSKYIGCWFGLEEAAEENGEMRIAHAFEAVNDKQAKAKAALLFMEAFPDGDDSQFEFRMYAEADGIPCPTEEWDETFLFEHEWDDDLGHPVANVQASPVDFDKLQPSVRVAVLVKYNTTEITGDQLGAAIELQQGDSSTFDSHITDAISKMPAIVSMYPERILEAIQYIRVNCAPNKKWPEIKAALAGWLKSHEEERKEGAIDAIDTEAAEPSAVVVARPYKHTHETLDIEIASALWAGDVDPNTPQPSITRWANGIIKEDREDFKRWSIQLRTQPNILKYDRPTIFGVVRNVPAVDTYRFPESHKRYITEYLKAHGKMENEDDETEQNTAASTGPLESESPEISTVAPQHADDVSATGTVETAPPVERTGPFYYRTADDQPGRANKLAKLEAVIEQGCIEITKEEYQALKDAPPVKQQTNSAQPGINNLGNGRFSVKGLTPEQPQTDDKIASNEVEKTEIIDAPISIESEHFSIWSQVSRTDPKYTKPVTVGGYSFTSISGQYMFMLATKTFGPVGTGWGYEITGDEMLPGKPMMEIVKSAEGKDSYRILRDADGSLITELNHALRIKFWYRDKNGSRHTFEAWGHTPYMTSGAGGKITTDSEVKKKSLTDAIKKALSMLGFCADIFLGQFDDPAYLNELKTESSLSEAAGKVIDKTLQRKEFDEQFSRVADTMAKATSTNEVEKISAKLIRELGIQQKSASATGNKDFAEYLSGRLRRLSQIKDERIKTLTENQEQSA